MATNKYELLVDQVCCRTSNECRLILPLCVESKINYVLLYYTTSANLHDFENLYQFACRLNTDTLITIVAVLEYLFIVNSKTKSDRYFLIT